MKPAFAARILNPIKSSLAKKLVISYLLVVLIPLTASGIYFFKSTEENYKKGFFSIVENQMLQLDREITDIFNLCSQNVKLVVHDNNVDNLIQSEEQNDYPLINMLIYDLAPKFSTIRGYNTYIHSIRIIHGNPKIPVTYDFIYFDSTFYNGIWSKLPASLRSREKLLKYNTTYVEPLQDEAQYIDHLPPNKNKVFTMYAPIYNLYMNKIVGVVEANILDKTVFAPLKAINFKGYEDISLIYKDGRVLYSSNRAYVSFLPEGLDKSGNFSTVAKDGKEMYLVKRYIKSIDSWLVFLVPEKMVESGNNYKLIFAVVFAAGLATLSIIAYFLSKLLLNRLLHLSHAMDDIKEGRLDTRINIQSDDEVGHLALNFNDMVLRINRLMDNLEKSNRIEKEAIYKALENQINPHFLCNALEMVRMTAEVHDDKEVSHAIELLASYFMYNIKKKDRYVSLKDEIKNVNEYLGIYNLIKNNGIEYNINVCDDLSGRLDEYKVLKFIVQPVVENSIKHGFAGMKDNCRVSVNISREGDRINIIVEDNGAGISVHRIKELREYLDSTIDPVDFKTSGSGIGLRNINERLNLYYGKEYGILIDSAEGLGTSVTIRLPLVGNTGQIEGYRG